MFFTKNWLRVRNNFVKLIGISAATAMTIRFIYYDFPVYVSKSESNSISKNLIRDKILVNNEKLVSVILVTRHGARTPLHILDDQRFEQVEYRPDILRDFVKAKHKLVSLNNQDFTDIVSIYDKKNLNAILRGGASRGMLTVVGQEQMYDLGRRLKERYVDNLKFLSSNYNPNEIYVRSSHFIRTVKSSKCVLAGMYAKSPNDEMENPFLIHTERLEDDILFPNALNCVYFAEVNSFLDRLSLFKNREYIKNLKELNRALRRVEGDNKYNQNDEENETAKNLTNYTFTQFRDDMSARQVHGYPVPKNFQQLYEKSDKYAAMELYAANEHNLKISCGQFLGLIKQNLLDSVKNDRNKNSNNHKFLYYSAHDSTINALLAAFDLINDDNHSWPPFAANLLIELWKYRNTDDDNNNNNNTQDYYIKLHYCGKSVTIQNCLNNNGGCALNDFIRQLEVNTVDKREYEKLLTDLDKPNKIHDSYKHKDKSLEIDLKEEEVVTDNFDNSASDDNSCFVAVHIGAGFHSFSKTGIYRNLCENISQDVIELLKTGMSARDAVAIAVSFLENSPLTNAGRGSNLTLDEKVECDASIMDKYGFGSVGAISNIKNPILVAKSLLDAQSQGTLSFGRIVPCMLTGEGARIWANEHKIEEATDEYLKTDSVIKTHRNYKHKLDEFNNGLLRLNGENKQESLLVNCENNKNDETQSLDTVGAIVIDKMGNLATAVSSGGILLKHPGRVGHASFFGCGCWIDESFSDEKNLEKTSIGVVTTGCGEYIIKTLFAKECTDHILKNKDVLNYDLNEFFKRKFYGAPLLKTYSDKFIGAMICKFDMNENENGFLDKTIELIIAHTTPSMCFGYMSSGMHKATSEMSRLDNKNSKTDEHVLIRSSHINLCKSVLSKNKDNLGYEFESTKKVKLSP